MSNEARPLGDKVDFAGARFPERRVIEGRYVRLAPLDPAAHGPDLWAGACEPGADLTWDYLPYGPFADRASFAAHLDSRAAMDDQIFFTVSGRDDGIARGIFAFMNIVAPSGVIEIGHVWFAPSLQRTQAASEAVFLMMGEAFDRLGYRRLEWKCNALNAASRRAAERFGFTFEGVFRQHVVVKGRNRDTAWYALIDSDWPSVRRGFEDWLGPDNFDAAGRQKRCLTKLRGKS